MSIKKDIFICPKCSFEIRASISKHVEKCNGKGPRRKQTSKFANGQRGGWNKDKSYDELYGEHKSSEIKLKISNGNKGSKGIALTEEKEIERRNKIRNSINARYKNGWDSICGRAPKLKYQTKENLIITVDGTWELAVAKYLDSINVVWKRNTKRFPYLNLENKNSTYKPDFYVKDWNCFIEVKGYKTDLDNCKWSQFNENLQVWDKAKLKELKLI